MSMPNVQHVWEKSQSKGSARLLLTTIAIHGNDCCGVAWPSDTTLRHEVNVSRQRIHELKNAGEETGELLIIERPGTTNLYFIAHEGKPVGLDLGKLCDAGRPHERGCPLRDPALCLRVVQHLTGTQLHEPEGIPVESPCDWQATQLRCSVCQGGALEQPAVPVDTSPVGLEGVSDRPDPQVSGSPDRGCQEPLTQKSSENKREKKEAHAALFSLSPQDGADAPEDVTISPEVMRKFDLRYNLDAWPPRRREKNSGIRE
jgi:hypothetical protein